MDWVRPELVTVLASVACIVTLWLARRTSRTANSRSRLEVESEHPIDDLAPKTTRPRLEVIYPEQTHATNADADVDIIAVHGLGSDADWSWTCNDGGRQINWLRDPGMLPAKVPRSRIMVYRYESRWHADAPKTRLSLCGEELVHTVHSIRANCPRRPIVFVGHSFGGNVIVQAFLYANDDSRYKPLLKTTVGLVFLGTPFRGSKWQLLADSLAQITAPAGSHRGITRELRFDGDTLRDRLHYFCKLRNKLSTPVSCFSELRETSIAGMVKGMIVDETSACIPGLDRYALDKDHLKMNKYDGPTDPAFERVSDVISDMCRGASDIVRRRDKQKKLITDNSVALDQKPEARDCLCDLFVTDPREDRTALKRKKGNPAAGTCEWILGTEILTAWLGSSQPGLTEDQPTHVVWLHGNPGTGKSTLAIFLTEELSTSFSATDGNTLAYFFCDSAFDTRKTATSIIRGLLLQLVQQHPQLLTYVLPKYYARKAKLFDSFEALWTMFISAAADRNTGRKYCIIDALDECDRGSQETLLRQLRETFQSPNAPPNVRILVTSRPYPEIRKHLEKFVHKDLASFPEATRDIERFIKERVAQLNYTEKIKGQVAKILREKAEKTFLWVGIACNELEDVPSKDAISHLEAMPRGLHSLYDKLLNTALKRDRANDAILLILRFVAVSQRPLNLLELSEACRLCPDETDEVTRIQFTREYIESCRLIIVIQDERVLLLHQSVKDYLIKAGKQIRLSELEAHADLAYRCIDHLIEQFHTPNEPYGYLIEYAAREWPEHARMAHSRFEVKASQAEFFQINSPCREYWLELYRHLCPFSSKTPRQSSILHVAARWGIPAVAEYVFRSYKAQNKAEKLIDHADASRATPIECAVEPGHLSIVRVFLDLGGELTTKVVTAAARNPESGNKTMALLLDQRGDEITITDEVITAAAGNNGNGKEVMALLLDRRGDEINITEEVIKAAAGNRKEVVALLLDRRGDEITITEDVVKAAARNWLNGKEVMTLLLDRRGDEINITEEVIKAAAGNRKEVVALLLDRRGDEITITEDVVKAAAGKNGNSKEVMARELLNGKQVMERLLDQLGDESKITEEVVKAAHRESQRSGGATSRPAGR